MTHPMIEHMVQLRARDDRAALATLRRAAAGHAEAGVYPLVARFFPSPPNRRKERALIETAILFGLHPSHGSSSVAAGLRIVRDRTGSDSIEMRFVALLDAHPDDLFVHLRHAVALLRTAELAIDYDDLLLAIQRWGANDRHVQRRWAREFWATYEEENP